ncbi:TPA: hypothetical protein DIU22_03620 [Candidatus Woesebacteria bacterium]|nr:hypothetical protein [Candidatus Woesebacteria bacterium]HLA23016.1 sugar nucleotide-binding protein [Candidatus Nanoarchaeia archaeon]
MKNILITGSSGNLGSAIVKSGKFQNILTPSHKEMDIANKDSVRNFFQNNDFETVIHCAAIVRVGNSEEEITKAINTNVIGTSNLVNEVLKKESEQGKKIRFIHISTDGVYSRAEGNYSENSPTIPMNPYGWTKLAAESSVRLLKNFCIIRTSFFNPDKLNFSEVPEDVYTSKMNVSDLVDAIKILFESDFVGTINVGNKKISNYNLYKKYIRDLKPVKLDDIKDSLPFELPRDSSMDVSLWEKLKHEKGLHNL